MSDKTAAETVLVHEMVAHAWKNNAHLPMDDIGMAVRVADAAYAEPVADLIRLLARQLEDYRQALDDILNQCRGEHEMEACASNALRKSER